MSEPAWNVASFSESQPTSATRSETGQDLIPDDGSASQPAPETSFPPVSYSVRSEAQTAAPGLEDDETSDADEYDPEKTGKRIETRGEHATSDGADEGEANDEADAPGNARPGNRAASISTVIRGTLSAAIQAGTLVRSYPRASMASILSGLILVVIWIIQPGKGKNDTTAQIAANVPQKPTNAERQIASNASTLRSSSPPSRTEELHRGNEPQSDAVAPLQPAAPAQGQTAAAGKSQTHGAGTENRSQPKEGVLPAPAPIGDDQLPPLSTRHVELAASGSLVTPAPGVEAHAQPGPARGTRNPTQNSDHLDNLIQAPEPAPSLTPVIELAAAEEKPHPSSDLVHAPAPALTAALPPVAQIPNASAPAPTSAAAPAPVTPGSPARSILNAGNQDLRGLSNAQANAATGAAIAATMIGGAAAGGGLVLAHAASTYKEPYNPTTADQKQVPSAHQGPAAAKPLEPAPAKPLEPAPVPVASAAFPPALKGETDPPFGNPSAGPAPVANRDNSPLPPVVTAPGATQPPPRADGPSASVPGVLPTLHPAGDSLGVATLESEVGHGTSRPGGSDHQHGERTGPATPAQPSATLPNPEPAGEGWVRIRHSGGEAIRDVQRAVPGLEEDPPVTEASNIADPSSHADKDQSFDAESPASTHDKEVLAGAVGTRTGRGPGKTEGKLDTVLHKVEGRENFWDISRMYYDSGRYYRALWKANSDKVPDIAKLYQGTVIRIPPPEDLDPAYIDPPSKRSGRIERDGEILAGHEASDDESASMRAAATNSNRRQGTDPADRGSIHHSRRLDGELNLPVADATTVQASGSDRSSPKTGQGPRDEDPDVHTGTAVARPMYKVHQYDTLRTIARDTLGSSRRANEILELNRDIINDPAHLIAGQLLELPEDARPARARSRD